MLWLPVMASDKERFAGEELRFFFGEASGCRPETVTDAGNRPYIRLQTGDSAGDGYTIRTEANGYSITGDGGHGTVYGVYALCRTLFGLEFFTPDVWTIDRKRDVAFAEINLSEKPDIPLRAIGIYPLHDEHAGFPLLPGALRMRVRGMADGWGLCNHSYFRILPPAEYAAAHPDWYSAGDDGKNLCLTNADMRREFTERLKRIVADSSAGYFMIGQQDNTTFCNCPRCTAALRKYGGSRSKLMVDFTNAVVRDLNAWLAETDPERRVVFCMFAYQQTVEPPPAAVTEEMPPLEQNLAVMLAPLGAAGDISYFDRRNRLPYGTTYASGAGAPVAEILRGWKRITDRLFFWAYDIDYADALVPFCGWDAVGENYENYKRFGTEYLFVEGTYSRYVPNFNHLRTYLHANMMWNTSADPEALIDRFMHGYYGPAAGAMRIYFDALREHGRDIRRRYGRPMLYVRFDDFPDLSDKRYWPEAFLRRAADLHACALSSAGRYAGRVSEEAVPGYYLLLLHYADRLSPSERKRMAAVVTAVAEKYGLYKGGEGIVTANLQKIKEMTG